VGGPDAPRLDGDTLAGLVDRILVSAADARGGAEVRLSLRQDVLPGTEVRIRREEGGEVSILFVTQDVRAERLLLSGRLDSLHDALSEKFPGGVRVAVAQPDGEPTAEARPASGDRGESGDQPRDGRSRGRDLFAAPDDE
jgi:hypothetical protein